MDSSAGAAALIVVAIGNVATLVALWLKNRHDERREIRQRQWQVDDRERLARDVETASVVLAAKVDQASSTLAATAATSHAALATKIDENTMISERAVSEANSVNEKIARLTVLFTEVKTDTKAAVDESEVLERVDETTQATLKEVRKR